MCMEEAKRVQCPMLIVHGAKDAMCPQFHAEENIRGSEMFIIEEGKHNLYLRLPHHYNVL